MLYGGMNEYERQGYHIVLELIGTARASSVSQIPMAVASLRPER